MHLVSKTFSFCAAHMLVTSYTEQAQKVHGHNYSVDVVFESSELNQDGMVVDFGKIKDIINPIIDDWDHKMILLEGTAAEKDHSKVFLPVNPTAENMARILYLKIEEQILCNFGGNSDTRERSSAGYPRILRLRAVRVSETNSAWAEYTK